MQSRGSTMPDVIAQNLPVHHKGEPARVHSSCGLILERGVVRMGNPPVLRYSLDRMKVCIKGAGEMASAVAWRLFMVNVRRIVMLEAPEPLAVRRKVSFCEAIYDGAQTVEGVRAVRVEGLESLENAWAESKIAVAVDPGWELLKQLHPDVVVDAVLAKKNLGTTINEAPLVIALGPGFCAGADAHFVIETNRGHNLGRVIDEGYAEPNTGIPATIKGFGVERVLRAPADGMFKPRIEIGDVVKRGDVLGWVSGREVEATMDGLLRGLIRPFTRVSKGMKIGDIDPRVDASSCYTISDKARSIAGSVLEAILRVNVGQPSTCLA